MNDGFGLVGILDQIKAALELLGAGIIGIVLVVGVALVVLKHKSGVGFVISGLVGLVLLSLVAGPLQAYFHAHIHG